MKNDKQNCQIKTHLMRCRNISILKGKILALELCLHDVSGCLDPFVFPTNVFKILEFVAGVEN